MRRIALGRTGEVAVESNGRIALLLPNLAASPCLVTCPLVVVPNVKDEPRPQPARLVPHSDFQSGISFENRLGSTRRDGCGRWLWRLVRRIFVFERTDESLPLRMRVRPE